MLSGFLVLNKPAGFTSHDAVAKLRGILKMRRVGHAGTLDPMAEGVLVMLLGTATRASEYASGADKEYVAGFELGVTTDTQDSSGTVLSRAPVTASRQEVEEAVRGFLGQSEQMPPMYSAVQVGGVRLYDLARQGIEVERKSRGITISDIELLPPRQEDGPNEYRLRAVCSKGAYIRTLCHDIGQRLGCGACMTSLTRIRSGGFTLQDALGFDEIAAAAAEGRLESLVRPVDGLFADLPALVVNAEGEKRAVNGAHLTGRHLQKGAVPPEGGLCRVYAPDGGFLLLGVSGPLDRGGLAVFCRKYFTVKEEHA